MWWARKEGEGGEVGCEGVVGGKKGGKGVYEMRWGEGMGVCVRLEYKASVFGQDCRRWV